jgi:hypothetical protein
MGQELAELDAPPELKETTFACVQWSAANQIATANQFTATADHLKEIKTALKRADDFFDPPIAQAFQLHKMLVGRKKIITDPLKQSEGLDKAKMLGFQEAERAKAEAERRRLQAIADEAARKEREKIEQAAAKQRAIEEENRRKAEAARQAALAEEDAAKRKKLQEEAEAADRKAAAAAAKVEVKEEAAAAVVAPVIAVASAAPKMAGISTSKRWKAEIVDLPAFLAYCCEAKRTDLLLPNYSVLEALAKGLKEMASIPGVKFAPVETMSARS